MKKINFGIIGTVRIAQQFLDETKKNNMINIVGICARNFQNTIDMIKEKLGFKYDNLEIEIN